MNLSYRQFQVYVLPVNDAGRFWGVCPCCGTINKVPDRTGMASTAETCGHYADCVESDRRFIPAMMFKGYATVLEDVVRFPLHLSLLNRQRNVFVEWQRERPTVIKPFTLYYLVRDRSKQVFGVFLREHDCLEPTDEIIQVLGSLDEPLVEEQPKETPLPERSAKF